MAAAIAIGVWRLPGRLVIAIVRFYQLAISPMLGSNCRFTPTCSQYAILAIKKYGVIFGCVRAAGRILRCNPWCKCGYDPP
jgi:putative membrane protein insertion efficiency factor